VTRAGMPPGGQYPEGCLRPTEALAPRRSEAVLKYRSSAAPKAWANQVLQLGLKPPWRGAYGANPLMAVSG
jgi:hypothetical protein